MGSRFLSLALDVREQPVQFLDHRLDFQWQRFGHPVCPARAHVGDRPAYPAQRAEPVPGLQGGHAHQAKPENDEAPHHDRADAANLGVHLLARRGDGEPPLRLASGQDDRAFDDPQGLAVELVRIVDVRLAVEVIEADRQAAVPQRARGEIVVPPAADLPVEPAIRLEKPLVAQRAVEEHLAIGADLGRGDHCGEHIAELLVEIARDQASQGAIEQQSAAEQEHADPRRGGNDHALLERAGVGGGRDFPHLFRSS